jgi:hypothetical protein
VIKILNGKAYNIIRGRGTFYCWVSVTKCNKGHSFLNNILVKIFGDALTRARDLFRIIY